VILDRLDNAAAYKAIHPGVARAFDFLKSESAKLAVGRHQIDGDKLIAIVEEYTTRPANLAKWEAHRRYWDIQYVERGVERMGYANLSQMRVSQEYDAEKDFALFNGNGDFITVKQGMFVIYMPQDVHAPGLAAIEPVPVRKIVMKVLAG
jgi:YhcH/YjgK/YiaL family protein